MENEDDLFKKGKLSSRELEVIQLIKAGLTTKAIAKKLNISRYTAETLQKNIQLKLTPNPAPPGTKDYRENPRADFYFRE
jgi:DNA-binding NarL/FixJ family response regulator